MSKPGIVTICLLYYNRSETKLAHCFLASPIAQHTQHAISALVFQGAMETTGNCTTVL